MRYRLRTLLILLTLGPMVLAASYHGWREWRSHRPLKQLGIALHNSTVMGVHRKRPHADVPLPDPPDWAGIGDRVQRELAGYRPYRAANKQ